MLIFVENSSKAGQSAQGTYGSSLYGHCSGVKREHPFYGEHFTSALSRFPLKKYDMEFQKAWELKVIPGYCDFRELVSEY